jgi:hypothetical protein
MSTRAAVLLASVVASLAVPTVAAAKGDAVARISSPTRCDASPGTRITIRFAVTVAAADGTTTPFGAAGVFVVLRREGRTGVKRAARATGEGTGRYVVRTRVPRGGVRRIDVGLDGTASTPGGAPRPAPVLFRVVGDPCRRAG